MKIAVFHGTMGSPQGNWFPWLKKILEQKGHTIFVPKFPTPEDQNVDEWVGAVQKQIPDIHAVDILIGHSCGASFIPHLVQRIDLSPKKIILVSAFSGELGLPDYDALNRTFFLNDLLLKDMSAKNIPCIQFHGDDDPYVPLDQARFIAKTLACPLRIIPSGGHLNAEFGYTEFPEILDVIG